MSTKSGAKANTVRLPGDIQKAIEAIASRNHIAVTDVIRLCLMQILPVVEKEGIILKPGKTT